MIDWQHYERWLKKKVKPARYRHCQGTRESAEKLARRFGEDPERAALAGLLHDCAKGLSDGEMVAAARAYDFPLDDIFVRSPALLHAPAGAYLVREELGITDPAVLSAICWHTVPGIRMTGLDKVVSVADLVEAGRDYPGVEELRKAADRDLDEAFALGLARVMVHVLERERLLHPNAVTVYNDIQWKRMAKNGDSAP